MKGREPEVWGSGFPGELGAEPHQQKSLSLGRVSRKIQRVWGKGPRGTG